MRSVAKLALGILNSGLRWFGVELITSAQKDLLVADKGCPKFRFEGHELFYFAHPYNCGWPPGLATERTVELALADRWLELAGAEVIEIGAVTPYYWPGRVARVVDPIDQHHRVTDHQLLTDIELRGATVLSISTIEHIGLPEYGLEADAALLFQSITKLFDEAARFLVTIPVGYNPALDSFLFEQRYPANVALRFLVRDRDRLRWVQETNIARVPKEYRGGSADAVAVLERGGLLIPALDHYPAASGH